MRLWKRCKFTLYLQVLLCVSKNSRFVGVTCRGARNAAASRAAFRRCSFVARAPRATSETWRIVSVPPNLHTLRRLSWPKHQSTNFPRKHSRRWIKFRALKGLQNLSVSLVEWFCKAFWIFLQAFLNHSTSLSESFDKPVTILLKAYQKLSTSLL